MKHLKELKLNESFTDNWIVGQLSQEFGIVDELLLEELINEDLELSEDEEDVEVIEGLFGYSLEEVKEVVDNVKKYISCLENQGFFKK